MNARTHCCAAIGCKERVRSGMLMCYRHWKMVGKQRGERVSLWWERMQSSPMRDHPDYDKWVQSYEEAVRSAVNRVAELEGRTRADQA